MMCFECVEAVLAVVLAMVRLNSIARSYDCETFSHVSCILYGLSSDYSNRTTWPLVLGKLFLVPMKNAENTWPERI